MSLINVRHAFLHWTFHQRVWFFPYYRALAGDGLRGRHRERVFDMFCGAACPRRDIE